MNAKLGGCLLVTLIGSSAAYAQSSVTLYGKIEDGLNFTSNARGNSAWQLESGYDYGSRWGLKGTEDLGGGVRAQFQLENGFDVNTGHNGQGGRQFGRQAWVGLSSDRFGALTLGRQYDPSVDMFSPMTANGNWTGYIFAHPYDNDNTDYSFRVNNSVKYVSPTYRGFTGEAMYGFSNEAGGFSNNRLYGFGAQYVNGGLSLAASYLKMNNATSATTADANPSGAVTSDNTFNARSQQNIGVGVNYTFSNWLLGFAYSHVDVYDPTANAYFTSDGGNTQPAGGVWHAWKFDNFEVSALYHFTHALYLGGAYTYTQAHLTASTGSYNPKWHQLSLKLNYDLSARTSVYLEGAYQRAVSANTGTQFDYANIPGSADVSSGQNQMLYRIALIHGF
ncbi:porin [Paraburkholderia silvatlantica]|uniref:Porin n=1 Tax=Paraburkholderia silvatlantica TaxID=321895 RepID=A0ABR6FSJ9_9BURK|nr:porin [Paraburkholderia silvatlantica]MBB2930414.1 putative porin [Paraburkholderia silvatlantica]PVY17899.1 putative porin [Paraburkholderia silvatlantica]PXW23819.1 putative porin [Paraburkholderia silvatlantica]TDQ73299.1 putative porin [Paraburkholderia silvatlantica]